MKNDNDNVLLIDKFTSERNFVRKFIYDVDVEIMKMQTKIEQRLNMLFEFVLYFCIIQVFFFNYHIILVTMIMYFITALFLNVKRLMYKSRFDSFKNHLNKHNIIKLDLFNF